MSALQLLRIDTREAVASAALAGLRGKLAADGEVVSQAGRAKTIEVFGKPLSPQQVVATICGEVRSRGLAAVLEYSQKIDRADLDAATIRVSQAELVAAHANAEAAFLASVRRIRRNIERFQTAILHRDVRVDLEDDGGYLLHRYVPLRRVGICVPGGTAAYPSTVLMAAVPALAAGVAELAVVAPPTEFGSYNQDVLATCHELGIREVYRLGGAQAVAALAYGIDGLAAVDKIVGPGNLFVALAKRHVYGTVDIDSIAGPSEVVVIADHSVPARWVAADLIAQAEHAPGSSVLITWDAAVADAVEAELTIQLAETARGGLAAESLAAFGALIVVRDADEAAALTDQFAPEHLHIECEAAEQLALRIRNAGATFVGGYTPVALGDYVAGPSHVLPTSGTARFASGLSANDFLRPGSVIHVNQQGLSRLAGDAIALAQKEGLFGHARSVEIRND